jgi:diguanylate cyclase (GGDEF)-like protein
LFRPTRPPGIADFVLLPLLYYVGAKLGVWLTVMPEGTAILWPPNSALLAALIAFQGRGYVPFAALAVGAEVAADLPAFSLVEALLFGVTNVAEATIAFLLLARWRFDPRFATLADLPKFILAGPGIGALAAAFCGAAIYSHFRGADTGYLEFLRIWWFGDALGLMIFTPLLLSLRPYARVEDPTPPLTLRPSDWLIGLAALAIVGVLVASRDGSFHGVHIGPASLLPFVIFVAARFGTRWTAMATMSAAMVVIAMATAGRNPFGNLPPRDMVVQVQEFVLIMSLMALGLSALLTQLRTKQRELESSNRRLDDLNRNLEARVDERTAALKALNAQLEKLALTDALTGLLNRRAFMDLVTREIAHSRRQHRPLAVLMCDLDHFKSVNDRYGHPAGDLVLQQAAAITKAVIRASDTLVRYGGEEFVILAPDTDQVGALDLAERIRQALGSAAIETDRGIVNITASFGVTALCEDDENPEQLVRRADEALYSAKAQGRDRVVASFPERTEPLAAQELNSQIDYE